MKSFKLLAALIVAGLMLASCSVIPPIPLGANALGYTTADFTVDPVAAPTGFGPLAVDVDGTDGPFLFDNLDPNMPVPPATFRSVQGFDATVAVTGTDVPATITVNSGTLTVTLSDDAAGAPEPVNATVDFGPLTLSHDGVCTGTCGYSFDDPAAAAETLTLTLNGKDMTRLVDIITDHGGNIVTLHLEANIEENVDSMVFTVVVEENYIGF